MGKHLVKQKPNHNCCDWELSLESLCNLNYVATTPVPILYEWFSRLLLRLDFESSQQVSIGRSVVLLKP